MTDERVRGLYRAGVEAFRRDDRAESLRLNEEALALARSLGDGGGEALGLVGLSRLAFRAGDYERTIELARVARELARATGNPEDETAPLHMLAAGTRLTGDYDAARELYLESLQLNRELGREHMVAVELHNLAHVELHRGDLPAAERLLAEWHEAHDPANTYDAAMAFLNAAALTAARSDDAAAEELLRRCERTLADAGIVLDPDDRFEVEALRVRLATGG